MRPPVRIVRAFAVAAAALVAIALAGTAERQPREGLTLERIFSDPRLDGVPPRQVTWSPKTPFVAFLWSQEGRRERDLWIYNVAAGRAWPLTAVRSLGGMETVVDDDAAERRETMRLAEEEGIEGYEWLPNGGSILFSYRGDLFVVGLEGGPPRRLTRTAAAEIDPQVSPDGKRVAFVRENDLWVMDLEVGPTVQVTSDGSETLLNGRSDYISLEELARPSAYRWSADSRRLVYLQADTSPIPPLEIPDVLGPLVSNRLQRRPLAGKANSRNRVGIVAAEGGPTRWLSLEPGVEDFYVPEIERLGDRIAILQQDRSLQKARLFLVDPASGEVRRLLEESDDHWINLDKVFLARDDASGALVYGSERSGWGHLYRLDPDKGTLSPITSGSWEVTALDRILEGAVYFTATAAGPAERHFYRADLRGGPPERLTVRPGWNEAKVSPDGAWVAILHSDLTTPPDLYVARAGSRGSAARVTSSPSKEFSSLSLPVPEVIAIRSRAAGAPVPALLIRPAKDAPPRNLSRGGKHPAIVRVHGAGYAQAVRRAWGGSTFLVHAVLSHEGYYVLDVDYRGSSGYGRTWRTAVRSNLGGLDLEDAVSAAEFLRRLPDVDPRRVAIWGWSYGGFLTNMAMLARPQVFDAGVAVAPVNDWAAYDTHYTEERLGKPQDQPEAYRKSSPITYASGLERPLLMIHGLRDDNVHAQDTFRLADALVKAGKDFDLMIYPEGKHGILRDESRAHLFKKMQAFLAERMPPRP